MVLLCGMVTSVQSAFVLSRRTYLSLPMRFGDLIKETKIIVLLFRRNSEVEKHVNDYFRSWSSIKEKPQ